MSVTPSNLARSRSRYKGSRPGRPSVSQTSFQLPAQQQHLLRSSPNVAELGRNQVSVHDNHEGKNFDDQESRVDQFRQYDCPTQPNNEALASLSGQNSRDANIRRTATREKPTVYNSEQYHQSKTTKSKSKSNHAAVDTVQLQIDGGRKVAEDRHQMAPMKPVPLQDQELRSSEGRESRNLPLFRRKDAAPKDHEGDPGRSEATELNHPPSFDAPISAVNAGERTVAVEYRRSVVPVAVTPDTTSVDLIYAASAQLTLELDPEKVVVMENFRKLGLERRLRRYEKIRNVLNSWDHDPQNNLYIRDDQAADTEGDLKTQEVPQQLITALSLRMYYSQRPRQWEKQTCVLRPDGQVLSEKKGALANICHMSDFDIYIPTKHQHSKRIKPPKRMCFAIKSQQKSNMFLSTENFVHFFSTSDKKDAAQWYAAVSGWRSWYLVNVMGEGGEVRPSERKAGLASQQKELLSDHANFSPKPLVSQPKSHETVQKRKSTRSKPIGRPEDMSNATTTQSRRPRHEQVAITSPAGQNERDSLSEPFTSNGLLGRTYTQKKKAQAERNNAPVVSGSAPMGRGPTRQKTAPAVGPGSLTQVPLVDLTPKFQEAPQHRKGKGVSLNYQPAGGLIDVATSPEKAVEVPPASTWRRPIQSDAPVRRTYTVRTGSQRHMDGHPDVDPHPSVAEGAPFSKGLLSTKRAAQGGSGQGRGVQTGDRNAEEPMLDLTTGPQYAPGSLLASVQAYQGDQRRPNIQRDALEEVKVPVGESS